MLEVQKFLSTKSFDDLTAELGIKVNKHETLPLVILNYDQIESPKTHPIVRECRGLVVHADIHKVVARSFNRFFNWGEVQDEMNLFDFSDFSVQSKEDGCFGYNTALNLWGGGTVKIGDVVSRRLTPTLIGMDESGELVPCVVTDWHDNGTKDNWLDIFVDCDVSTGVKSGNHPNRLRVTTNHAIYLNGSFRPAIEARPGDLLTNFEPKPSATVLHYMRSSLLGDGSISPLGPSFRFNDTHVKEHSEYMAHITLWLGECGARLRRRLSGCGSEMLDATSLCYKSLGELRAIWYPSDEKRVPADLDWMDNWSVAKWYMDDGCLSHSEFQNDRAIFSTHSFTQECVDRLILRLREMYGVDAVPAPNKGSLAIRINYGDGVRMHVFWRAIAPHIVPCMRYKLPEEYRSLPYVAYPLGVERCDPVSVGVKRVSPVEIAKKNFPHGRKGFDITTTTHNYFAKGVLVHNSLTLLYYHDGWRANTRGSFATDNMQFQNFSWKDGICKALNVTTLDYIDNVDVGLNNKDITFVCEFVSPWNKVVRQYNDPAMYLLTAFYTETGEELSHAQCDGFAKAAGMRRPTLYKFTTIEEIMDFLQRQAKTDPTFEGVVLRDSKSQRWKVKSATYLGLHRLKGEGDNMFNPKHLLPFVLAGEESELLTYFNEVRGAFYELKAKVQEAYIGLMEAWVDYKDIEDQKDFALAVRNHPFSSILFSVRKEYGKEQTAKILKKKWRESDHLILKKLFK